MPFIRLNENLLSVSGILTKLKSEQASLSNIGPDKIDAVWIKKQAGIKKALQSIYFEKLEPQGIQDALRSDTSRFNPDYTALKEVLSIVFSEDMILEEMITQIEGLTDRAVGEPVEWVPKEVDVKRHLEQLNQHSNYFDLSVENRQLMALFTELVIVCRKIAVLIEQNNTPDDNLAYTYAYRLMALCINSSTGPVPNLTSIAKQAEKLFKASNAVVNKAPYLDFLLNMVQLPDASRIKDMPGWRQFLENNMKDNAVSALRFFANAPAIEEQISKERADHLAPKTLSEAQNMSARCHFKRGAKNPEMAMLCKKYHIPEDAGIDECSFNKCFDYLDTIRWPIKEKEGDNLPSPIIKGVDAAKGYYWVKLPTNDLRALILGRLTSSCQSIGGHADLCVRDAVSLPNNGLYVLLKQISGLTQKKAPFNKDHSINYDDFEIVGQSYAWISKTGNLVLDSLECSREEGENASSRVPSHVAKELLTTFAEQVLQDSSIKTVTLGTDGGTPKDLGFIKAAISEKMRQGFYYGDSESQMIISQKPSQLLTAQRNTITQKYDKRFSRCMLYLAEYLEDTTNFTNQLESLVTENPRLPEVFTRDRLFDLLRYTATPTLDDLKPVNWDALPSPLSIGRLMWQADTLQKRLIVLNYLALDDRMDCLKESFMNDNSMLFFAANEPPCFKAILEMYPQSERFQALQEQDRHGRTIMHLVATHLESLDLFLQNYPVDMQLLAVKIKDGDGQTVLHAAGANPQTIQAILLLYPESERFHALTEKDGYGVAVVDGMIQRPEWFLESLNSLPETDHLAFLNAKDSHGNTILHTSVENIGLFNLFLERIPVSERLTALNEKNNNGNTLLHAASNNPELLQSIFTYYPSSEDRLKALQVKNCYGYNVLHQAVTNDESIKLILESLSGPDCLALLQERDIHDHTILYAIAHNPVLLKIILEAYPKSERLAAVRAQDILYTAASNPESLKLILAIYPDEESSELLKQRDKWGRTVLYAAAQHPESLKIILQAYSEDERIEMLQEQDNHGFTLLHAAATQPQSLEFLLSYYSDDEQRRVALRVADYEDGISVFHAAASNPESLKILFKLYPNPEDQVSRLQETDYHERTVFQAAASNVESLNLILGLYTLSQRFSLMKGQDNNGLTILHAAASHPESLQCLLAPYLPTEQLELINQTDNQGRTVLHAAASHPESLKCLLAPYSPAEQLELMNQTDNQGRTVLHAAASHPDSLKYLLDVYPLPNRLGVIQKEDNFGKTLLYSAASHPESLRQILNMYPDSEQVAALQKKNKAGRTILHEAVNSPESLRVILSYFPGCLAQALIEKEKDWTSTVLSSSVTNPESLAILLDTIPLTERISYAWSLLPLSLKIPGSLKQVLELLSEEARFQALKQTYKRHESFLSFASENPESLYVILALIPQYERLALVTNQGKYKDDTPLRVASENTELFRVMLNGLSLIDITALLRENNPNYGLNKQFPLLKAITIEKAAEQGFPAGLLRTIADSRDDRELISNLSKSSQLMIKQALQQAFQEDRPSGGLSCN